MEPENREKKTQRRRSNEPNRNSTSVSVVNLKEDEGADDEMMGFFALDYFFRPNLLIRL